MIFDSIKRTDSSPIHATESNYSFLNRSARPEFERIRIFLEEELLKYPKSERSELIARFQSKNDDNFASAEFELLLFGLLTRLGFVLTAHPVLPNGSESRPDFHVVTPSGEQLYLEAVLASERKSSRAFDPLIASTLDALRKASHPNYYVVVSTKGYPTSQPSGKKLLRQVLQWLDQLEPNELDTSNEMHWSHESLTVTLRAWPIRTERRGQSTTLLGGQIGGAGWVNSWAPIREAIKYKGGKYGELERPLIVAVNHRGFSLDELDERQALFGPLQYAVSVDNPDQMSNATFGPDGAWTSAGGPTYTRVSGAWLFGNLTTTRLAKQRPTLYLNPWANIPIPKDFNVIDHAFVREGSIERISGKSVASIFSIAENWLDAG